MKTYKFKMFNRGSNIDDMIELVSEYFKETHKDNFIGNEDTIRRQLIITNTTIIQLFKGEELIGYFDFRVENEYDNLKNYIYVQYMYIKPKYRSKLAIGYMYRLLAIISHLNNDIPIVGDTYEFSSNKRNNERAGGIIVGKTYMFKPCNTKIGKALIEKGKKLYVSTL